MESGPDFSDICLTLLRDNDDCNQLVHAIVVAATDEETVARIAIEHLRNALPPSSSQPSWQAIGIHLQLIDAFLSTQLRNALLCKADLIDAVIGVLQQLNSVACDLVPAEFVIPVYSTLLNIFGSANGLH